MKRRIILLLVASLFHFAVEAADTPPVATNVLRSLPPSQLVVKDRRIQIPTNTPPQVASNFFRLLPLLTTSNINLKGGWESFGKAHVQIERMGPSVLPVLVAEMNKTNYISGPVDPRWTMRMRLAQLVQNISGKDFACQTSVHGWNPNHSFNAINDWWTNTVLRR